MDWINYQKKDVNSSIQSLQMFLELKRNGVWKKENRLLRKTKQLEKFVRKKSNNKIDKENVNKSNFVVEQIINKPIIDNF